MTKLASTLPDGHGLDAVRNKLLEEPHAKHVAVAVLDCSKVTIDYEKGGKEPYAAIRTIEVVHPEDLELTRRILTRGQDRRLGATVLPLDMEDDITAAFTSRSEDVGTDLASNTKHLTEDQVQALASSLDRPLWAELGDAIQALRASKEWVTLGRARRVLQLAIRKLQDNDLRLLRDDDGNLVDPETGDVVDEDTISAEDVDRMLLAFFDQSDDPLTAGRDEGGSDSEDEREISDEDG